MFAIHSPQTVELRTDNDDEPAARMNFSYHGADTSKCKLEIMSKDRVWTVIFNQRGYVVEQSFVSGKDEQDPDSPLLTDADYIVNGVDTRSFNPYTHRAPVDADTAYRDGATPGFKQPGGDSKEARDARKAAIEAAHGEGQKAIEEQRARMDEKPEERVARERKERDEKLEQVSKQLAKDNQVSSAPKIIGEPERNPDGSVVSANTDQKDVRDDASRGPGYDPLVPAASSPMPNSAPPHRQSRPDTGVVNTSQSMGERDSAGRNFSPNPDRT